MEGIDGVETVQYNLCQPAQPFVARFDVIFFSEVIEHLPLPVIIVAAKLRRALRPNGIVICSTPKSLSFTERGLYRSGLAYSGLLQKAEVWDM